MDEQTSLPEIEGDEAVADTPQADPGDENPEPVAEEASPVVEVNEPAPEVLPEQTPTATPTAVVADYAEILALQKKILRRHGRQMFDQVSLKMWKRITSICEQHIGE